MKSTKILSITLLLILALFTGCQSSQAISNALQNLPDVSAKKINWNSGTNVSSTSIKATNGVRTEDKVTYDTVEIKHNNPMGHISLELEGYERSLKKQDEKAK